MARPFTVQCGHAGYFANTVAVEADTIEEALEKAIEATDRSDAWRSIDHCGDTFVAAVCEGADADPWGDDGLPVPGRFSEHGEPPLVTVSLDARGKPHVRVSGGRARVRILDRRCPDPGAVPHRPERGPADVRATGTRGAEGSQGSAASRNRPGETAIMRHDTMPAACPPGSSSGSGQPRPGVPAPQAPADEARKRAIAHAVWTDLLWLMPPDRTVTITARDGRVAVDLGPAGPAPETAAR